MNGEQTKQTNSNGSQKWLADVARLQRVFGGLAAVGLAVSVVGILVDRPHFWFSYLTAYTACLTIVWGMMFFVMLHYIADAGWSTVVRRPAEQFLAALPATGGSVRAGVDRNGCALRLGWLDQCPRAG